MLTEYEQQILDFIVDGIRKRIAEVNRFSWGECKEYDEYAPKGKGRQTPQQRRTQRRILELQEQYQIPGSKASITNFPTKCLVCGKENEAGVMKQISETEFLIIYPECKHEIIKTKNEVNEIKLQYAKENFNGK